MPDPNRKIFAFDITLVPTAWRDQVNHESPKALRVRKAVQEIHARGEYPGHGRVQRELGDRVTYNLSGRDNAVRKREMGLLGISLAEGPAYDPYDDWDHPY